MERVKRQLRVFTPWLTPESLNGLVTVSEDFFLDRALRQAAVVADRTNDNDNEDASVAVDFDDDFDDDSFASPLLDESLSPSPFSSPPPPPPSSPSPRHIPSAPATTSSATSIASRMYFLATSCTSAVSFSRRAPSAPSDSSGIPSGSSGIPSHSSGGPSDPSSTPSNSSGIQATSSPAASPHPNPKGRNQRKTRKRRNLRHAAYQEHAESMSHPLTRGPLTFSQRLVEKYSTVNIADTLSMSWFSVSRLAHAVGAWIGLREFKASNVGGWTAEKLVQECGFTLVEWDGTTNFALVDRLGNIVARCLGFPADSRWQTVCKGACAAMDRALKAMGAPQCDPNGRRGWFTSLFTGFSMGGGQQYPMPMDMKSQKNARAVDQLCKDPNIRKIAHYGSTAYAFTSPKAFRFLDNCLLAVESMIELLCLPSLFRPFPFSVFAAVHFNLGNNVTTILHRDHANIIFGMCAIHALGRYDYKKGGHLILWDWKIVIEFPPGTTILIPSAAIAHGNTPLADPENEERKSFTQYVPGGIVRWWSYGYRTEEEVKEQDPAEWRRLKKQADERWKSACGMFSKVHELHSDILEHLYIVPEPGMEVVDIVEGGDE